MILFLTGSYFLNWVKIFKLGLFVSKGKGESGTNNLSEVWSSNPGECKIIKKTGGGG